MAKWTVKEDNSGNGGFEEWWDVYRDNELICRVWNSEKLAELIKAVMEKYVEIQLREVIT